MRAVAVDQAVAAFLVAKQHQVFAEQFDGSHRPRPLQLIHQRRRLPVHPHQLAAGVFAPGAGDQVVLFLAHHGEGLREICSPIELLCDFNVGLIRGKRILEAAMPKLKRVGDADNRGATDFIESLDRGLRVLEVFGGSQQPMTLSDLAKAADLPRATARRILFTLERAGFVATDGKLFRLMPRVLVLASSYLASNHIVSVLQPMLDRVSSAAQEIFSMAILDGNDAVFIARASPTRVFSAGIDIGYRLPAFCTSVGRVLPSQLSHSALAAARDAMDLKPMTAFTVTDKRRVLEAISGDRKQGYSLVDREAEPGFRSISV